MLEELRYFTLPKILLGLTLTLAIILGLAIGGYQPLTNVLHLRTTIPYYITLTKTMVATNTTTVIVNRTLTATSSVVVISIYTTTTTVTITNTTTVRTVVIQPVTVTVNYTTTVVSTVTLTPPPPGTGGSIVPGVNLIRAIYDPEYFIVAFRNYTSLIAPYFSILGLRPITQFACYATGFRLPNGSSSVIVVLVGNTTGVVIPRVYWPLSHGVEVGSWMWAVLGVNTTSPMLAGMYAAALGYWPGYTVGNVTIAGGVLGSGFIGLHPQFPYIMPNGTYLAWLLNWNQTGVIYPCILEVINTWSWDVLANQTYLGAQYVAYAISTIVYGHPAPCYRPWIWTIGYALARLNITEPIGPLWQYYCGPNGVWRSLKP